MNRFSERAITICDNTRMNKFLGHSVKKRTFWCNSHQREATGHVENGYRTGEPCCDRKLSGILLPCSVVELTDIAEVVKS